MSNIFDDGVVVDRKIKEYQSAHPGTSYDAAYRALIKLADRAEREMHREFDRRVETEMNGGTKEYSLAAEKVLRRDPKMAMPYADMTDQSSLARRVGQVMAEAKRASTAANISMADATMKILQGEREVAQKIGGDWLHRQARIEINNQNLGSSLSVAYPLALRIVRSTYPEVTAMADSGVVSETAMRTVFIAWFKD